MPAIQHLTAIGGTLLTMGGNSTHIWSKVTNSVLPKSMKKTSAVSLKMSHHIRVNNPNDCWASIEDPDQTPEEQCMDFLPFLKRGLEPIGLEFFLCVAKNWDFF